MADDESDVSRWLRHVRALEAAIAVGDVGAARLAWFELGLELARNTYVVLRPGDLPILAGGRQPTLDRLCEWVQERWQRDLASGLIFDTVQAVARALLRQSEDWEP